MKWARVVDGVVFEVIAVSPHGRFHPDIIWTECPTDCQQNWLYDGETFSAPPPPPPEPEPDLVTEVGLDEMQILLGLGYTQEQVETEIVGVWTQDEFNDVIVQHVNDHGDSA